MTVTSGYFGLGALTSDTYVPSTGVGTDNDLTVYSTFSGNGTQQSTGSGSCAAGTVVCFDFGPLQLNTFMAASSSQSGVTGGGPTLSGQSYDATGGTTVIDTSGFFMNWNAIDMNQGNVNATLTTSNCVAGTCDFTASWTSVFIGGPIDGFTGSWIISGQVSGVIPVPAAAWLMGSGVAGLAGAALRKRKRH
jgi:hypothetical protein